MFMFRLTGEKGQCDLMCVECLMVAQSSKGDPHTLHHTAPSPIFPQTNLGDT